MDETQWSQLTNLFDRMLKAEEPTQILASERDPEIRSAAIHLWEHHVQADEESYLEAPLEFGVTPVFQPGQTLIGRFRIERQLGSGGMGEVYLAWDLRVEDYFAIKTIARLLSSSPELRRRFVAEVQNARRVTHPHICRIHELFDEGETPFFSMEYLEGVALSEALHGPIAAKHARSIAWQIASGLRAAHQIGVVHGDFKPANVILVPARERQAAPRAVIMDFGLARAAGDSRNPRNDNLSLRAGTVAYMAPELREGGTPTIASDIYAFGKVALELLPAERLWRDCTRNQPEHRPASLDAVVLRLDPAATRRHWILGGVGALTAAAGYGVLALRPPKVEIPADSRILVNGFRAVSAQIPGARMVRGLFLKALEQSARIHPILDEDLAAAIKKTPGGAPLPLSGDALSILLKRLRAAFWVEGDVREGSGRFSLDLRLMSASQQEVVTASSFHDASNVFSLARSAATWVRTISGESARSLDAGPSNLEQYRSITPEALQKYYEGIEDFNYGPRSLAPPALEEAIRLDPEFAQPHHVLALSLNQNGQREAACREIEIAMQLGRKLSDRERLSIETTYYSMIGDPALSLDNAARAAAYRPDEPRNFAVLAETQRNAGIPESAIESYRAALRLAPDDWMFVSNLEEAFVEARQPDQAIQLFEATRVKVKEGRNWIYCGAGYAYLARNRCPDALAAFGNEPPDDENAVDVQAARILAGDLDDAISELRQDLARPPRDPFDALHFLCGLYYVTGRTQEAIAVLRQMAAMPAYPSAAKRFSCAASWARRLREPAALAQIRAGASAIADRWPSPISRAAAAHAEGSELWLRNSPQRAEELLLEASVGAKSNDVPYNLWALFDLAELYTMLGRWELAGRQWIRFENCAGYVLTRRCFTGALVLGWLLRAVAAQGSHNRDAASRYSKQVLDCWSQKNPAIPAVEGARTILAMNPPN